MTDIMCQKCGEPWDSYGITYDKGEGDMTLSEAKKFLGGEGCPACGFGMLCPACQGKKIEDNGCRNCYGSGRVLARKSGSLFTVRDTPNGWEFGYIPNVRKLASNPDLDSPLSQPQQHESLDGKFVEAWAACPRCLAQGTPCHHCVGTGLFSPILTDKEIYEAMYSALDASDDPESMFPDSM